MLARCEPNVGRLFSLQEETVVVAGFGSVGKTTLYLDLQKHFDDSEFQGLCDDTIIISNTGVTAFPQHHRLRRRGNLVLNKEVQMPMRERKENRFVTLKPDLLIVLQEDSKPSVRELTKDDAKRRMLIIQNKTFPLLFERHIAAFSFCNTQFMKNLCSTEEHLQIFDEAQTILISDEKKNFAPKVRQLLSNTQR